MENFADDVRADRRLRHERAAVPVARFLADHDVALWHAARLLGGYEAARLVDRLSEALRQDCRLSSPVRIMANQLLSLLTLQNVHDPDRAQMGYFAAIDPGDPVVEEICLLADGLTHAIEQANSLDRDHAIAQGIRTAA